MEALLGALMGTGLAISAGLRAFLPLAALGIAAHLLPDFELPDAWRWLEQEWVIVILLVLLILDLVADKVPWLDTVNDIAQTVVRPAAGGIVFGAGSGATSAMVTEPSTLVETNAWLPITIGVVIALGTHLAKLAVRAMLHALTGGIASPAASVVEDGMAVTLSLSAILLPIAVLVVLAGIVLLTITLVRRTRARRAAQRASTLPPPSEDATA